jgi:hypothetical protein
MGAVSAEDKPDSAIYTGEYYQLLHTGGTNKSSPNYSGGKTGLSAHMFPLIRGHFNICYNKQNALLLKYTTFIKNL